MSTNKPIFQYRGRVFELVVVDIHKGTPCTQCHFDIDGLYSEGCSDSEDVATCFDTKEDNLARNESFAWKEKLNSQQ
jgi:hypothetical protein